MDGNPLTRCYTVDECWNAATGISASALNGMTINEVKAKLTRVFTEILVDNLLAKGGEVWIQKYVNDMIQDNGEY